jgi:hypothetical protein
MQETLGCDVIDMDSGEVLASFPNSDEAWDWVNRRYPNAHEVEEDGGSYIEVKNTANTCTCKICKL